jgi:ERCC4-type nuclease
LGFREYGVSLPFRRGIYIMKILIDQKEQAPWHFGSHVITSVVNLPTGDYAPHGHEHNICVERKSLSDLVHTVIHDWQRFSRQLRRMAAMDVAFIVCEAPVTALMEKQYASDTNPLSVRGKLNKILLHFGVHTVFLDNRDIAQAWVENLFTQYLEK